MEFGKQKKKTETDDKLTRKTKELIKQRNIMMGMEEKTTREKLELLLTKRKE